MRPDLDVQRELGGRVQVCPRHLAEPLGRLPDLVQGAAGRLDGPDSAAEGAERGINEIAHALGHQLRGRRQRLWSPRLRLDVARDWVDVEQDAREVEARDPVDHRVMRLRDQGEAVALEALDEPRLPQRLGPIEALRVDAPGQRAQLLC